MGRAERRGRGSRGKGFSPRQKSVLNARDYKSRRLGFVSFGRGTKLKLVKSICPNILIRMLG